MKEKLKIWDKLRCKDDNLNFDTIIEDIQEDVMNGWFLYVLKIITWDEKGKFSIVHTSEFDENITKI